MVQGAIAGTTTLTFGVGTASLTGAGELVATGVLTFGHGTSVLTGAGTLAGADALALGGAATLAGSGALAGPAALLLDAAGTLVAADGSIDGTAALAFGATGAIASLTVGDAAAASVAGYAADARRRRRKREDDESKPSAALPSVAQAGPGSADATPQAPAADLELVRNLVAYWTGEADREQLNRRAQRALDYALRAQTVLAMQLFERELARQMEDDEMSALLMILADD
jgi:hypothetical protein